MMTPKRADIIINSCPREVEYIPTEQEIVMIQHFRHHDKQNKFIMICYYIITIIIIIIIIHHLSLSLYRIFVHKDVI